MEIVLSAIDKGGEYPLQHDLNFQNNRYEAKHPIVRPPFPGPPVSVTAQGEQLSYCMHGHTDQSRLILHLQTFKNPKPALLAALKESGPVPGDENGVKKRSEESAKKKKRPDKGIDMDKLADGLQRLGEDDLLQVVQMVHDNKTQDSYTKNDVESMCAVLFIDNFSTHLVTPLGSLPNVSSHHISECTRSMTNRYDFFCRW